MAAVASIYLDHAATTPVRDEVAAAMDDARRTAFANPSSPHAAGRRARARLEDCRERILRLLGATGPDDRLVFTSGATEANRLAVLGLAGAGHGFAAHSARDHGSCATAVAELAGRPGRGRWHASCAPLTPCGTLDAGWLDRWAAGLPSGPRILCTTLVCGQTGILEDLLDDTAAGATCAAIGSGLLVHVDATQAVGLGDVAFARLPAATMTLAPHKFGGPRGIGGLVVRGDVPLTPQTAGPQEAGLRGGTEPVALAAGFAAALELAAAERATEARRIEALRDRFERGLAALAGEIGVQMHVVGGGDPAAHGRDVPGVSGPVVSGPARPARRAPHISTIAWTAAARGIDRQAFAMAADLEGVCVATGTACASGSTAPAPAVAAMGLPEPLLQAAVRFSFGRDTTVALVDEAVVRLGRVLARMAIR